MRVLLIGGGGQAGQALRAVAPASLDIVAPPRAAADLTRPDSLETSLACRPDVIVNAGACTAVDVAEDDEAAAFAVNARGAEALARLAARGGIPLVHLSTDYVFDGAKPGPYAETDPPDPLNAYGRSKLAGEAAVRALHKQHVILRTAWLYGARGRNFVRTILARAPAVPELRVVSDQRGSPTSADDLARALLAVVARIGRDGGAKWGTYHVAGEGAATWFELAQAALDCARPWLAPMPRLTAIGSAEYPARARRPANSALDCSLFARTFGAAPGPWRDALPPVVAALAP
jgi:dTDP-4-dehydrorhamnose reductase